MKGKSGRSKPRRRREWFSLISTKLFSELLGEPPAKIGRIMRR
jgi:hypothetical protein